MIIIWFSLRAGFAVQLVILAYLAGLCLHFRGSAWSSRCSAVLDTMITLRPQQAERNGCAPSLYVCTLVSSRRNTAGHWPRLWNWVRSPDTPTQQPYPANMSRWLVGKSKSTTERNTWSFPSMTLTHLASVVWGWTFVTCYNTDCQSVAESVRTPSRLRGSRLIPRLWYERLSEARHREWLFPASSSEYVPVFLCSTWRSQTQPPKYPEFYNPGWRTRSTTCHVTIYHPSEHFKEAPKSSYHRRIVFLSQPLQYCRSIYVQASQVEWYK